jgi:methylmalonyl-CoA mutase C-terminal domain/subunit
VTAPPVNRTIRVLLTKPQQDCHDRGVRYLARELRDAGFEVVFTNFLLVDEIVETAIEEDVDVVGVSSSSGGHMPVFEDLMARLQTEADDVIVIGGGVIPAQDAARLREIGVGAIFGPGQSAQEAVNFIREATATAPATSG